ncbi:hypothetical protein F4777DRAFT_536536 [Nemania sp. FL0916]|nr:hypothetical protein F4777DRAFT_536536 [Nemania sp. FL0916]
MHLVRAVDLSESRQPDLYAAIIVSFFFAIVAVGLRFWSRWIQGSGFWLDDWAILVALISAIGLTADQLWWIPLGLGKHIEAFGPNVQEIFAIGLFTAELTYTGVIVFVKLAILALLWRLFRQGTGIRLPVVILTTAVLMWGTAVFLLTLLQCIPPRGLWDKTVKATCNVDSQKFLFAISIPNILIDITLLALPIPFIIRLNMSKSHKRAIISIFLLGGFVCIASILRLVAVLRQSSSPDVTWNIVNQSIWASVEANLAIVSACLPTLRPVWLAIQRKRRPGILVASGSPTVDPEVNRYRAKKRSPISALIPTVRSKNDPATYAKFFPVSGNSAENFIDHEPQPTGSGAVVSLSTVSTARLHQPGTITVESSWNVEHTHET